jgi:hypothetical protein
LHGYLGSTVEKFALSYGITFVPLDWVTPNDLSEWAVEPVKTAIDLGLVTRELQSGYKSNTTRAEFCRAAVNFLEKYYGKTSAAVLQERGLTAKTFADTTDATIGAAAALGITSGTDAAKNLFSPDVALTREQAATMLNNVMKALEIDVSNPPNASFTDIANASDWAQGAINSMFARGIMSGTSTTEKVFSPKSPYTHEQSIMTFNNLWNHLK